MLWELGKKTVRADLQDSTSKIMNQLKDISTAEIESGVSGGSVLNAQYIRILAMMNIMTRKESHFIAGNGLFNLFKILEKEIIIGGKDYFRLKPVFDKSRIFEKSFKRQEQESNVGSNSQEKTEWNMQTRERQHLR